MKSILTLGLILAWALPCVLTRSIAYADQLVGSCPDEQRDPDGRCPPPAGCSRAVAQSTCAAGYWNGGAQCCGKSKAQLAAERAAEDQRQRAFEAERTRLEQERVRREDEQRRLDEQARKEEEQRRKAAFSRASDLIERDPMVLGDITAANLSEEYRALARQKRRESITFLKEILSRDTAQGDQLAEMLLRLADLYYEEGRDLRIDGLAQFDAAYEACAADERCEAEALNPADFTREATEWQTDSIALYREILSEHPGFFREDEATYFLAMGLLETGDSEGAIGEFTRLVRTYPDSRYAPDAYIGIGEFYFNLGNAYKALVAYQKAATYQDSDKIGFAHYKLAWCYYNVGEVSKAVETMKAVVAQATPAKKGRRSASEERFLLQDEALLDLTFFFAEGGYQDEGFTYFADMKRWDLVMTTLEQSATQLFEQGAYDEAIATCRRLIAVNPESKDAPEYQNQVIEAYLEQEKKLEAFVEIDRLLKTYGAGTAWAHANASDPGATKRAVALIERNLRNVAINFHNQAKKLGTGDSARETYALAYKAFVVYLNEFPDTQYAYDVRYTFSELLYKIKKYDEAYNQYIKVVEIDPKGKHSEFCAESAIFAADEMVKREKDDGVSTDDSRRPLDAVPLTAWETKLLAALDQYAELYPSSEQTLNIAYRAAYLLYNMNHFEEASSRFRVAIGMDPSSKEAEQAAILILDSFALIEDWINLAEIASEFLALKGLFQGSARAEIEALRSRALEQRGRTP